MTTIRAFSGSSAPHLFQRFIDQQNFVVGRRGGQIQVINVQFDLPAAALQPGFMPRGFDQDTPHRLGSRAKKMRAILPATVAVANHPQPSLMHQRRGLQRLAGRLLGHARRRQLAQFVVDERQ